MFSLWLTEKLMAKGGCTLIHTPVVFHFCLVNFYYNGQHMSKKIPSCNTECMFDNQVFVRYDPRLLVLL